MIPVTTFAGKKRRRLRPRQVRPDLGRRADQGRRRGRGVRRQREEPRRRARRRAECQDLRESTGRRIAALVLAPGVPLTHPEPHWSVQLAHKAEVDVIGDIELFCRERAAHRQGLPARSPSPAPTANRPPPRSPRICSPAPAATCRWAAISACRRWRSRRSRPAAFTCWKSPPTRSISRLRSSHRRRAAQRRRKTISTATAPWRTTPRSRRWCRPASSRAAPR